MDKHMKRPKYILATSLVISGVVMSYLSFFTPPVGEVSDSVLGYLGECLIWAGSMFGMTEYVNYKIRKQ